MSDEYESINRWLGPWIEQLRDRQAGDEYRILVDEMSSGDESSIRLGSLNKDLELAAQACSNFDQLLKEKSTLPPDLDEANSTVLNKLSEIRAIVGMAKLDFGKVEFTLSPDLKAQWKTKSAAIEVTRMARSSGKRSDVWDWESGATNLDDLDEVGYHTGMMSRGGKVSDALWEAFYREIEDKYPQVRDSDADARIIWISLGRDYLKCGRYELNGTGTIVKMFETSKEAAQKAIRSHFEASLCANLTHVAVCSGLDSSDALISVA